MQTFDCLSPKTPLLGPHFIEASAGTGKTFAIEHIVARLLLHEDPAFDIEQILVVTFTRAATRELKLRIRTNLEQVKKALKERISRWDYLEAHLDSSNSLKKIEDAIASFDQAQIFTIHSFCYRMIQEYAFEAGLGFDVQEKSPIHTLDLALRDFFEVKLSEDIVSVEQIKLLTKRNNMEQLARKLKNPPENSASFPFFETAQRFREALSIWQLDFERLQEDVQRLAPNYKKMRNDFRILPQLQALVAHDLHPLVGENGSLLKFFSPENRKVRAKDVMQLNYPGFFEWAHQHLTPIVLEACDPICILQTLQSHWKPIFDRVSLAEEMFGSNALLQTMRQALKMSDFCSAVQNKYQAALIDEFQDTDPIQWDIFQTLFLRPNNPLYLVGDPKQSIYRFRNADLYTYLKAQESFTEDQRYHLDTNYRSSKQMISTLNRLFHRQWLRLPKQGTCLPYYPVNAGLGEGESFNDDKGALHCFQYENLDDSYRYVAREIQRLDIDLDKVAILVKDHRSATEIQQVLAQANIRCVAKNQEPIFNTLAY